MALHETRVKTTGNGPVLVAIEPVDSSDSQEPGHGSVILVVNAAIAERRALAAVLRSLGHRFVEAQDGVGALDYLAHSPGDLIITDLLAPAQNAAAFCSQV